MARDKAIEELKKPVAVSRIEHKFSQPGADSPVSLKANFLILHLAEDKIQIRH